MDLVRLAKDPNSGRVGCPSVWRDRQGAWSDLLVQGDGFRTADGTGVTIAAGIVRDALGLRGRYVLLDDATITVMGAPFDVTLLPNPLPGELACWSTYDVLLAELEAVATAVPESEPS